MKSKGFTLVELLVMLVVLGILMAVTIPNISGILNNSRLTAYKTDASNLGEIAKMQVSRSTDLEKPSQGECIIFTLSYLDTNSDFSKGPYNGEYDPYESFVIYTKEKINEQQSKWVYYVRIVEDVEGKNQGIDITEVNEIESIEKNDIKEITTYGLTENDYSGLNLGSYCSSIKGYYARQD